MPEVKITVPGPVRGKGRPRATTISGHARMFTDEKTRNYESTVRLFASQAMSGVSMFEGPVAIDMTARFMAPSSASKKRRQMMLNGFIHPTMKPDTDNISKVKDALNGIVFIDDKQVVIETIRKVYADQPGLDIIVRSISGEPS